ncbi:MAG: DUF370 domain-containing protein [Clostridia bacterium]|nr:DUF370 domain-containing protein [Clostridia bacterium]
MIKSKDVIGIFDLDSTSVSKRTRNFLKVSEKKKQIESVSLDLPKSFVVCAKERKENKIYLSQLSSLTLQKRSGYIESL